MDFNAASGYLTDRLRKELDPRLSYHCVEHTLDVVEAARRLTVLENIAPPAQTLILTASLYHDSGMITQYQDHETASVDLALKTLPRFGYTAREIDEIAGLILVTKLPQRPYNHFEQIMCDADLDYLGRDDFFMNSFKLQYEWQIFDIRKTSLAGWLAIQIKFLSEHQYFTNSANVLRNEKKLAHLEEIRRLCAEMK
jgi:predicted metal-dependent HD superfamily phosphohydrolase